jgi:uncharacterized protein with GYD domain
MPTYIHLMELGRENLGTIEESPKRREAARELIESLGGRIVSIYYTFGRYDVVRVAEYLVNGAAARAATRFRATLSGRHTKC